MESGGIDSALSYLDDGPGCGKQQQLITYKVVTCLESKHTQHQLQYFARCLEPENVCHSITIWGYPEKQMTGTLDINTVVVRLPRPMEGNGVTQIFSSLQICQFHHRRLESVEHFDVLYIYIYIYI